MKKTREYYFNEIVLLVLSSVAAVSILPFGIIRSIGQEWAIAAVDLTVCLLCTIVFLHVWFTHKTKAAEFVLSIIFLATATLTISIKGISQVPWLYPSMIGVFFLLGKKKGLLANLITLLIVTIIVRNQMTSVALLMFILTIAATNVFAFAFSHQTSLQQKQLLEQTRRDHLTRVLNRRAFNEQIEVIFEKQKREYSSPSMVLLDIDNFKSINDRYGHDVGDEILIQVSELILATLRKTDQLFRIGGEEFVILPFETEKSSGLEIAEKVRQVIEQSQLLDEDKLTVSLGVAIYQKNESRHDWFKRADNALYRAKHQGKNKVCT